MTKLLNVSRWLLLTTLVTATAVACGDDDDDDDVSSGGTSSAGRGGSSAGRGGSSAGRGGASAGRGGSTSGGSSIGGNDTSRGGDGAGASESNGGEAGNGGAGGAAGDGGLAGAGGEGGAATAALQDAQILLVLDTLNQGEVEEAYAALPRLAIPAVQTFAQQMVMDHSTARQSVVSAANTLQLNPSPSEVQLNLKQEAEAHVAMLRTTPSANLDRTYIEMQLAAHSDALALLDDLEDAADAAELRALIDTLQVAVQAHHDQAVSIQGAL